MNYVLKHVTVERYDATAANLDNGSAFRIKQITSDQIGEITTELQLNENDIIVLQDDKWVVVRRILVRIIGLEYVTLYVRPYQEDHPNQYRNRQWTDHIPLFPYRGSEVYKP